MKKENSTNRVLSAGDENQQSHLAPVTGCAPEVALVDSLYAYSRDYRTAFSLIQKGIKIVGFVDYQFRSLQEKYPPCRDVCVVRRKGHKQIDFGVRGICYGSVDPWIKETTWVQFKSECERMNFEFIIPQHCR